MKIVSHSIMRGPNIYHPKSLLVFKVDMLELFEKETREFQGFNEKILELLPSFQEHECSYGRPGGFVQRMEEGTYFSHLLEHLSLELSNLAGINVTFGKARYSGEGRIYNIILRYESDEAMKIAVQEGIHIISQILNNQPVSIAAVAEKIKNSVGESFGPSSLAILKAAKDRGVPVRALGSHSLIQLGWGSKQRKIQTAVSDRTSLIAADLVQDKFATKTVLEDAFIPVPRGRKIDTHEELLQAVEQIKPPYVLKPLDGNHGRGVFVDLRTLQDVENAFQELKRDFSTLLLEEFCQGQDYRVLVINHRFTSAAHRQPPFVIGDGQRTILELIEELNLNPLRKEGHDGLLTKVGVDEIVNLKLQSQGFNSKSIPETGKKVVLRDNANLSSGGTAEDITKLIPNEIRSLCERISRVVGLDICGIDIMAQDLTKSLDNSFKVIEVNAGPGLRMHLPYPTASGKSVGEEILDMLMPQHDARIPIVSVTGTNGKTSVVKMLQKVFSFDESRCVGHTSTEGVWIGNERIIHGDCSGPGSAEVLLNDPKVDMCVFEVARGGLMRGGLAYDWADAAIITNVSEDHLGQNGLHTIGDLVWVKSLVAERIKVGGILLINADDTNSYGILQNERVLARKPRIILYSLLAQNPRIEKHLGEGHEAIWVEDGEIYARLNGRLAQFGNASQFPITSSGEIEFQVSNLISVLACSIAMKEDPKKVVEALKDFVPTLENPGRMNIYNIHGAHVILDYAHNPEAIQGIGQFVQNKGKKRKVLVGLPGDRTDELLKKSADALAVNFDQVYVRDEKDLRGRKSGEVPEMVFSHIKAGYPNVHIEQVAHEKYSLKQLLENIEQGDLLVVLFEDLQEILSVLREYDPIPMSGIQSNQVLPVPVGSEVAVVQ